MVWAELLERSNTKRKDREKKVELLSHKESLLYRSAGPGLCYQGIYCVLSDRRISQVGFRSYGSSLQSLLLFCFVLCFLLFFPSKVGDQFLFRFFCVIVSVIF